MKYRVKWEVETIESWTGTVEANSEEEAFAALKRGDINDCQCLDSYAASIENEEVEGLEPAPPTIR